MKYLLWLSAVVAAAIVLITCQGNVSNEERVARQYCGRCHAFPEPSLLPKKIWADGVLPRMAIFMGIKKIDLYAGVTIDDLPAVYQALPQEPMVNNEQWEAIKLYYQSNAPDSLEPTPTLSATPQQQFDVTPIVLPVTVHSEVTLIKADTLRNRIYVGTRDSKLYQLDSSFSLVDSTLLESPPSMLRLEKNESPLLLTMGIMDPNDQELGELLQLNAEHSTNRVLNKLKRPVFVERADLNDDSFPEIIACEFGNYTGGLVIYENDKGKGYKKRTLHPLPGARRVVIRDVDGNGKSDIIAQMTQGDESIVLFYNMGNFEFKMTRLLQFPPVYGSSYFDIADINGDGKFDVLYTNGDNADNSQILKPYHGVRVYLNDGRNQFEESFFFPMDGATQAVARDLDGDGDQDIAAIAYFPDFRHAEQSFIYFENKGDNSFAAHTTPLAALGRWITMETEDIDHDGDDDIILGALNFPSSVPDHLKKQWASDKVALLVLRNKQH